MSRLQNRHAPPLPESSVSHLDPEYEIDPMAATARPRHCKLDTTVLRNLGVDVSHVTFEDWWSEEMQRQARAEQERLVRQRQQEEQRRKEEEERQRKEEEERKRKEEEERQRREGEERRVRQEEQQREREEEERRRRKEVEEEERRHRAQAEEEEQQRLAHEQEQQRIRGGQEAQNRVAVDLNASQTLDAQPAQSSDQSQQEPAEKKEITSSDQQNQDPAASSPSEEQSSKLASAALSDERNSPQSAELARSKSKTSATTSPPAQVPTPSSPNPSFSSLRARPTPPSSSARSPTNSQPASLRNVEATVAPLDEQPPPPVPAKRLSQTSRSPSGSRTEDADSATATPQSSQTIKPNPFRTESPRREDVPATLKTGDALKRTNVSRPQTADDDDEDPYGEPSPRPVGDQDASAPDRSASVGRNLFKEGYGEVPISADDAAQDKAQNSADAETAAQESQQPAFVIKVGDPHKVGDAMTGHIVYTVRTQTKTSGFKAETFSSLRRYNDFRWLHAALVHNNPGIIIPPVPEKVRGLISRFAPDLVEARRHGLEICVNKIANHPVLAKDEDLKLFLESEDFSRDVKLRETRKGPVPTPEQKTWMGWSGTVGVNSGHKFQEYDEWFDQQKAYLDALEAQLKGMVKSINALAQSRKELADSIALASHSLLMLSGSSLSRSLSACFAGLGDLQRRAQELEDVQSDSDIRHFGSVLYEYERVVGSVRKAFSTRIDCWHLMQKADDDLRRTRTKHEKLKREPAANHYHEESLKDLAEAEDRALERKAECDKVSRRCKEEMKRFDKEKVEDLRAAVDKWLIGQIERREELLEEWLDYSQKCLSLDLSDGERKPPARGDAAKSEVASTTAPIPSARVVTNGTSSASSKDLASGSSTSANNNILEAAKSEENKSDAGTDATEIKPQDKEQADASTAQGQQTAPHPPPGATATDPVREEEQDSRKSSENPVRANGDEADDKVNGGDGSTSPQAGNKDSEQSPAPANQSSALDPSSEEASHNEAVGDTNTLSQDTSNAQAAD